jgi:hypothetical protein
MLSVEQIHFEAVFDMLWADEYVILVHMHWHSDGVEDKGKVRGGSIKFISWETKPIYVMKIVAGLTTP